MRLIPLLPLLLLLAGPLWAAKAPSPPTVAGSSHILVDFQTGAILSEQEPDLRVEPASITKMMTAYVVFHELSEGNIKVDDQLRVSKKAWKMPGSRMFIEVGKMVSVEELIMGMIIQSGNDASVALAEHVAGSEESFAEMMNLHAARLGLTHTNFANATGLPHPDHYVTARDMAVLAAAMIRDFPRYYLIHKIKEYTFNNIRQHNRNKLLWRDETIDGIKTGHTEAAGYCLVASAKRKEMRLIAVVMGTESENARAREVQKLLTYGFRFYRTHQLYKALEPIGEAQVWKGLADKVDVGITEELWLTVPRGMYKKLEIVSDLKGQITAPVSEQSQLGELKVSLEGELLVSRPLVALQPVPEGGLWKRLTDHLKLMLE